MKVIICFKFLGAYSMIQVSVCPSYHVYNNLPWSGLCVGDQLPWDRYRDSCTGQLIGSSQRWLVLLSSAMDERKDL